MYVVFVFLVYVNVFGYGVATSQLHVSFAEYSLFYRALLQKRPIILRSLLVFLYGVATTSRLLKF